MDNAKLMTCLSPSNEQEKSAIELFLKMTHDEIYDSEDEVILNFIQSINKEYVTGAFITKWTATYLDYLKLKVVQKISDEFEAKSEEITDEYAEIEAKILSEFNNPLYVLAKRLNDSAVVTEAIMFFDKHDINYREIYDSAMAQYALDLFHEIQQDIGEGTEAPSEETSGNDEGSNETTADLNPESDRKKEIISVSDENLTTICAFFYEKVGDTSEEILKDDTKLTNIIAEVHKVLPFPMRSEIEEQDLINYCLENRNKLTMPGVSDLEEPGKANVEPDEIKSSDNEKRVSPISEETFSIVFIKNFFKKNPAASKAIIGVTGLLIVGAIAFSGGEKDTKQIASEKASTHVSIQEEGKTLSGDSTHSNNVEEAPVALSVLNSVIAGELDSNNSPQSIADSFTNVDLPLYYYFSYEGKLENSELEVRLLQNDIEKFSHKQPAIKDSEEKAWWLIDEKLHPGEWALNLYADGSIIDSVQFSILGGETSESGMSQVAGVEQDNGQGAQLDEMEDNGSNESSVEVKKPKSGLVFIWPSPAGSRIRILNIKPKYEQGMKLPPGKYHIEVSSNGYQTIKKWIDLEPDEIKKLKIELKPIQIAVKPEPKEKIDLEPQKDVEDDIDKRNDDLSDTSDFSDSWDSE